VGPKVIVSGPRSFPMLFCEIRFGCVPGCHNGKAQFSVCLVPHDLREGPEVLEAMRKAFVKTG